MKFTRLTGLAMALAVTAAALTMSAPASAATTYITTCQAPVRHNASNRLNHYFTGLTLGWSAPPTTAQQPQPKMQQPEAQQPRQPEVQQPVQPAEPQAQLQAEGLTAAEQQMLNLVNQERAKAGLQPLQADLELTKLARMKSQDMINRGYFDHNSPTYGSPFDMMKAHGVSYRTAGENIAGNQTVERAHTALMNSSGHRANILNANYTHVGIGIVEGGPYGMMFTQMFVGR